MGQCSDNVQDFLLLDITTFPTGMKLLVRSNGHDRTQYQHAHTADRDPHYLLTQLLRCTYSSL